MDEVEERIDDYLSEEKIISLNEMGEILSEAMTSMETKSMYRIFREIESVLRKTGVRLSKEEQKKFIVAMAKGIEKERFYICVGGS